MKTEITFGTADPVQDIPQSWDDRSELTGQAPIEDDSGEGKSTIGLRKSNEVIKQADAVDVRETSVRAVACGEEAELRELYNVPEGGEVTPFQRLFAGLARDLRNITQNSVNKQFGVRNSDGVLSSESRGKSANARSAMLKMIMPELSRDQGDKLADAIKRRDGATVERIMTQIGRKLHDKLNVKNRK